MSISICETCKQEIVINTSGRTLKIYGPAYFCPTCEALYQGRWDTPFPDWAMLPDAYHASKKNQKE